jgi:hypothetical protein
VLHSFVDAAWFFGIIVCVGLFLSKQPVEIALAYGGAIGGLVFLWRVLTRTNRSTPPFRFPGTRAS